MLEMISPVRFRCQSCTYERVRPVQSSDECPHADFNKPLTFKYTIDVRHFPSFVIVPLTIHNAIVTNKKVLKRFKLVSYSLWIQIRMENETTKMACSQLHGVYMDLVTFWQLRLLRDVENLTSNAWQCDSGICTKANELFSIVFFVALFWGCWNQTRWATNLHRISMIWTHPLSMQKPM